jgi:hypothetical protein
MLLAALLGWLEREQRDVIAFLREENVSADGSLCWGSDSDAACCEKLRRSSRQTPFSDGIAI